MSLRCLAMFPDRNFVEESMGTKYVNTARLEFYKLYEDSGPSTAVFFILSPGVNPLKDVEKLGIARLLFIHSYDLIGISIHECKY